MIDNCLLKVFYLLTTEYKTANQMAKQLNVSIKTVRNLLKELNKVLEQKGAQIVSKHSFGYKLHIVNKKQYQEFQNSLTKTDAEKCLPKTSKERIRYLLDYLLNAKDYVRIRDLGESLYVSRSTLISDLKRAEKILNRYNLILIRRPNHGIKVSGKEFDYRLCIANHLAEMKQDLCISNLNPLSKDMIDVIKHDVLRFLQEQGIKMSDFAFQNLVTHIYVAVKRIKSARYVSFDVKTIEENSLDKEFEVAMKIAISIEDKFHINFPPAEIGYMAIHLAGKKMWENAWEAGANLVISPEINKVVIKMLDEVYEIFKIDFREDLELRMTLCQHLLPLEVRIKYDMNMKNPLIEDIKERFSMAYTIASQACIVLNLNYETRLREDEIGYIALAFALALERQRTEIVKKNVLLVCSTGKGSAQLLAYRYLKEFGSYINQISICNVNDIADESFKEIDYVFTTVPISVKIPVPIMQVQYFFDEADIQNVKRMLLKGNTKDSVVKYYKEDLFISSLDCKTKEEVLSYMCRHTKELLEVPQSFYESVMKREAIARTEFGNLVAMPHPNETMSKETFVCVAILKEPILWEERDVQVVFLVSVENSEVVDLQNFYEVTAKFLLSTNCIQELIKNRTYETMMALMLQIEEHGKNTSG